MNVKKTLTYFVVVLLLTISVSAVVGFLYSYLVHGTGMINWESSFSLAIILGIVLTWMNVRDNTTK